MQIFWLLKVLVMDLIDQRTRQDDNESRGELAKIENSHLFISTVIESCVFLSNFELLKSSQWLITLLAHFTFTCAAI